jgi:hypothetical protein
MTTPAPHPRTVLFLALSFVVIAALVFLANTFHSPQRDAITERSRNELAATQNLPETAPSQPATTRAR